MIPEFSRRKLREIVSGRELDPREAAGGAHVRRAPALGPRGTPGAHAARPRVAAP